jgi:hypothetical protein
MTPVVCQATGNVIRGTATRTGSGGGIRVEMCLTGTEVDQECQAGAVGTIGTITVAGIICRQEPKCLILRAMGAPAVTIASKGSLR